MFTGIIQEIGVVKAINRGSRIVLTVNAPKIACDAYLGGSVSVNGACLSVVKIAGTLLDFDAIPETINHTNFGQLKAGDFVNIEPAMKADSRFDGHIVQGHVDETGKILSIVKNPGEVRISVKASKDFILRCISKGSVAIDGISLTITKIADDSTFEVAIIPTSLAETTLKHRKPGDSVNLESDVMLKYVERIIRRSNDDFREKGHEKSKIDENCLRGLFY